MHRTVAACIAGLILIGCSGSDTTPTADTAAGDDPAPATTVDVFEVDAELGEWIRSFDDAEGEPISFDQATVLAGTLNRSAELGEGDYQIVLARTDGDGFEVASGRIDFPSIEGSIDSGVALGSLDQILFTADGITGIEPDGEERFLTEAEYARTQVFVGALLKLAAPQQDNPVLVQQNGTVVLASDDDTVTVAIEGNRDAVIQFDADSGVLRRALLWLTDPVLPNGNAPVVYTLDFDQDTSR